MINKIILTIFIVLYLISIVSAVDPDYVFKQNVLVDLKRPCLNNNTWCSGTAQCNITIIQPNSIILFNNAPMTNKISFHNITIPSSNTSINGLYKSDMVCIDNGLKGAETFYYKITATGTELSNSQAILYFLIFLVSMIFFLVCSFFGMSAPYKNKRDEMTGYIFAIENLKYVKMFLIALSYLMLVLMAYFGWMISYGYLDLDFLGKIFNFAFYALLYLTLPLFVIGTFVVISNFVRDQKVADLLQRGLRVK